MIAIYEALPSWSHEVGTFENMHSIVTCNLSRVLQKIHKVRWSHFFESSQCNTPTQYDGNVSSWWKWNSLLSKSSWIDWLPYWIKILNKTDSIRNRMGKSIIIWWSLTISLYPDGQFIQLWQLVIFKSFILNEEKPTFQQFSAKSNF